MDSDEDITLRPIEPRDDAAIAAIIRQVMTELGAAGPGFAIHDAEVDAMSRAYARPGAGYFVVERDGRPAGGAGFAPLTAGLALTCELRKMYFLPEARGLGAGERLVRRALAFAREAGYHTCYLETIAAMTQAQNLRVRSASGPETSRRSSAADSPTPVTRPTTRAVAPRSARSGPVMDRAPS